MKKTFKILFGVVILLLWQTPALARENVTDWYIKDFQTEIKINQDSSLDITENILADCGTASDKHGIFRVLPKKYKTKDGNFVLPLELISITNQKGEKIKYSESSSGDSVTYKIGDPNVTVNGENFYQLKYHIKNAVRTGNQKFDEFYWNVLGNYWDLEIDNFSAKIIFPVGINRDNTNLFLSAGELGSKENSIASYQWNGKNILEIKSLGMIQKKEGVTISASFPKNIITPYQLTFKEQYGFSVFELIFAFLILIFFLVCSFIVWKKYGRDPRLNKTTIPEFEIPESLTPIEMGGIIKKGDLDKNSLAATIIRLGVIGYLKIEKNDRKFAFIEFSDFKLIRTEKPEAADLYEAEKFVLNKIFESGPETNLSSLGNSLYPELSKISEIIFNDLCQRGFVERAGKKYQKIMLVVCGVLFLLFGASIIFSHLIISAGLFLSAFVVLLFSLLMSRLAVKGAEINWRIKGFKLYMNTAEKYRSRFQEQENILDKLLPYAILFGITKKWLNKMKEIYGEIYFATYQPAFMIGAVGLSDFNNFTTAISQIESSVANSVSPSSSGAGGGGAGGGAGGGGGGGW